AEPLRARAERGVVDGGIEIENADRATELEGRVRSRDAIGRFRDVELRDLDFVRVAETADDGSADDPPDRLGPREADLVAPVEFVRPVVVPRRRAPDAGIADDLGGAEVGAEIDARAADLPLDLLANPVDEIRADLLVLVLERFGVRPPIDDGRDDGAGAVVEGERAELLVEDEGR